MGPRVRGDDRVLCGYALRTPTHPSSAQIARRAILSQMPALASSGKSRRSSRTSRLIEEGRTRGRHDTWSAGSGGRIELQRDLCADEQHRYAGEVVWSWPPGAEAKLVMLLDECRERRGQERRSPGRARISRQTIAQGRPDIWLNLWFCRVLFCCTRTAGVSRYPAFPAPSAFGEGDRDAELGRISAARTREHVLWCNGRAAFAMSSSEKPGDDSGILGDMIIPTVDDTKKSIRE
jgi:hypothetical protein